MNRIGLGLIGLGTVGTGVLKILQKNRSHIFKRVGTQLQLVQFCDKSVRSRAEVGLSSGQVVQDYKKLLSNESIHIIIELIGGYEPARTIILDSLRAGKHVVTANKAVLAKYWGEIFSTAQKHKRLVYFEASVGGGIPVIQGLNEGLAANRIKEIIGILNGTTNFILTRMSQNSLSFDAALKEAQKSGFAEADPTFDIQGIDSAHKLAVLSSIAFGSWIKISDIYCEGIDQLDLFDLEMAKKEFGYGLKLLGIARERNGKVEVRVHPTFLPNGDPFLAVQDEYNAISILGDAVGDVIFYGKGAGQMAAASAVVSDIIFLARRLFEGTAGQLPYVTYNPQKKVALLSKDKFQSKYYLRFMTADLPGVLSKISGILGSHNVSIASVFQPQIQLKKLVPILLTTHSALEGDVQRAIREIDHLPFIKSKSVLIRAEV